MKKRLYIFLSIVLGVLLSFIVHAAIELWYLNRMESSGKEVVWRTFFGYGACALPDYLKYGLIVAGLLGGFLLGKWWWRAVYIQGRHWRNKNDSNISP